MKENNIDIKSIQSKALDIFKAVKVICDENDIRYFAISGTAIGAVRHKGIIPWDDDIDLAMPRKDYEHFTRIAPGLLPGYYRIIDGVNDPTSQEMAMRISDDRTTMTAARALFKKDTSLYKGISIDIMPLDGVPSNYLMYRLHRFILKVLYTLNGLANQTNRFRWNLRVITSIVLGSILRPINRNGLFKKLFRDLNSRHAFDDSKYLARTWWFASHDGMQAAKRYYQEDFLQSVELAFEDTMIRLPKGYDRYLSSLYPNYMTPPPKEKQIPHYFDGIIDTEHSSEYHIARQEGKTIGYVPGSFDMFHIGHLNIIRQAKKHCDYLIAGVNSDTLMFKNKNKHPIVPEAERLEILRTIKLVDEAVLIDTKDKLEVHKTHGFDILFVGSDYKGKWDDLEKKLAKKGAKIHYFDYTQHTSSTKLRSALESRIHEAEKEEA